MEKFNQIIKTDIKNFTNLERKKELCLNYNTQYKFNYIIYDIILLLLREYLKGSDNIDFFIDEYIILSKDNNEIQNKEIVINSKINSCETIIEYYKIEIYILLK